MDKSSLAVLVAFGIGLQALSIVRAQTRVEIHPIHTVTVASRQQFLAGDKDGRPTVLAAELRIPPATSSRALAVLVHGSGGLRGSQLRWADELNRIGVAVFLLDSFTGRGITATARRSGSTRRWGDDGRRVTGTRRHVRYRSEESVTGPPIRLFHGEADDYTPIRQCRDYAERLRGAGVDIALTAYPGAHHGFDNFELRTEPERRPNSQTARNCRVVEGDGRSPIQRRDQQVFTLSDECIERGIHVAHDRAATEKAVTAVKDLLTKVFGLPSQRQGYPVSGGLERRAE